MPHRLSLSVLLAVLTVAAVAPIGAFAQGPTGSISGRVTSSDGMPLPGVSVRVTSPHLQGTRTVTTSENGDYLIALLPPGRYTLTFEREGFQPLQRALDVAATQNASSDVSLAPAGVSVTVQVVGEAQPSVETAQVAVSFEQDLMALLPSNRTIDAALLMSPALHATGPRGAYTINGSQSYENLYTLNGAVINENLRGAPMTPYIEDALQEVTVSTAGISAEYGRFSGGVANAITKSGGNVFSGSFRTSFANDSWRAFTPFESDQLARDPGLRSKLKLDRTVPTYEATLGGPFKPERLWFFTALRNQKQEATRTTVATNIPYIRANEETRYEGKLTYTARPGHALQGSYLGLNQVLRNNTGFNVMDVQSLTNQGQPQNLYSVQYTGVLRPNLFIEAQYSARHLTFTDVGASTKDRIFGTVILDISKNYRFWSPTFCSGKTCDGDEERNNSNFVLKGSSFLSTESSGSHYVVFGYDYFNDNILANTRPNGSDFRVRASNSIVVGEVVYPQFIPGTSATSTAIDYNPIFQLSEGSNLRTHSLFVNDTWRLNNHVTLGLGLRVDKNQATDGGGANVGDEISVSPRLSAIWDPAADGRWALSGSFARYVMALTSNLAGATTAAGNAATFRWFYQGPPINADANAPLVPTDVALARLFEWFDANGGIGRRPYAMAVVPGVNMKMLGPLESPYSNEFAAGLGRTLGMRGSVRVDGVFRDYKNLYSLRTDLSTGRAGDQYGNNYDLSVVENTNDARRRYVALLMQGSYTPSSRFTLGGNYTLSRAYGNVEAETAGGPSGASINSYPEYRQAAWNHPDGDLSLDQRHRARGWMTYAVPLAPDAGAVTLGLVQQVASGVPYGAVGFLNPRAYVTNPGYLTPPSAIEYYFTDRDAHRSDTTYRTDLSVNYSRRLFSRPGASPEIFVHGEVLNLLNVFQLCGCGDSVFNNGGITNVSSIGQAVRMIAPFDPYTAQPVQNVNWAPHANFGTALNSQAYTTPRLFRLSAGIRF